MTTRVQCGVTAGLAIVGASVMAVAPLTLPMPSEAAPVTAEVQLTATPMEQAALLVQGLAESGIRAGSGVALTPIGPVLVGAALASGDNQRAYSVIRQSVDAPLWAADPTIDALATVLPRELGGGTDGVHEADNGQDGALINFRDDVLWAAHQRHSHADQRRSRCRRAACWPELCRVGGCWAAGIGRTIRHEHCRCRPLGLIPIAQAIAGGSEEELYVAIRQYIDAPTVHRRSHHQWPRSSLAGTTWRRYCRQPGQSAQRWGRCAVP